MTKTYSPKELQEILNSLPGWSVKDGKLVCEIHTKNWKETIFVVNGIATLSESHHHHPDLEVSYRTIRIILLTHDTGGVTDKDIALAKNIQMWLDKVN